MSSSRVEVALYPYRNIFFAEAAILGLSSMNLTFKCCVNEPAIAIFTSKHKGTRATIVSGTNSNTIQRLEESPIVVLRRACSVACAITPVQTNKQADVIEEISRK